MSTQPTLRQYTVLHQRLQEIEDLLSQREETGLAEMFHRCIMNTLETTVEVLEDDTTFVVTGDIPAMWLRDSTAQVRPYLVVAAQDSDIQHLIKGLIRRQTRYILLDAYANAFNRESNGNRVHHDRTETNPWIWERKYELDSLCYPIQLCYDYLTITGDQIIFDEELHQMLHRVVDVMTIEQRHDEQSSYYFERDNGVPSDTLPFQGKGTRSNYTGMIWSGFRPSDDACRFGFLIPANMFAVVVLKHIAEFAHTFYQDQTLEEHALRLRSEVEFGIQTYGIVRHPVYGSMYAYETDGFGNYTLMDDANVPSLLSLPYLGYCSADASLYRNTRKFILSTDNPYFYHGTYAQGIGSPHTPDGYIWPIALCMQGLTSLDEQEQEHLVKTLVSTTGDTGFMHESFHPDHPEQFTRSWFAWANSLFGEFIYRWITKS